MSNRCVTVGKWTIDLDEEEKSLSTKSGSTISDGATAAELELAEEVYRLRCRPHVIGHREAMNVAFALMEKLGTPATPTCDACLMRPDHDPVEDRCISCHETGCMSTIYGEFLDEQIHEGDLANIVLEAMPPPSAELVDWLDWFERDVAVEGDFIHGRDSRAYLEAMSAHWERVRETYELGQSPLSRDRFMALMELGGISDQGMLVGATAAIVRLLNENDQLKELADAALRWWRDLCPASWDEAEHLRVPATNTAGPEEGAVARCVAGLVRAGFWRKR